MRTPPRGGPTGWDTHRGEVADLRRWSRIRKKPGQVRLGIGLTSMQERVGPLGGNVWIEGSPGQGTTVTAVIPLSQ